MPETLASKRTVELADLARDAATWADETLDLFLDDTPINLVADDARGVLVAERTWRRMERRDDAAVPVPHTIETHATCAGCGGDLHQTYGSGRYRNPWYHAATGKGGCA